MKQTNGPRVVALYRFTVNIEIDKLVMLQCAIIKFVVPRSVD